MRSGPTTNRRKIVGPMVAVHRQPAVSREETRVLHPRPYHASGRAVNSEYPAVLAPLPGVHIWKGSCYTCYTIYMVNI